MAAGQLSLLGFMVVAIALHPGLVLKWNEAGLSNYGVHAKTAVPYSLALSLGGGFAIAAARALKGVDPTERRMRHLLVTYGVLMFLTLVSTYGYTLNRVLKDIHFAVIVISALFLSAASIWLFTRRHPTKVDAAWLCVQLLGLSLEIIDYAKVLHVLFAAQLLAGVGFGVLSVRAVRRAGELK